MPVTSPKTETEATPAGEKPRQSEGGVFPAQALRRAADDRWIRCGDQRPPADEIQPASIDLRLGETAFPLRCSFLPDPGSAVKDRLPDVGLGDGIDLRRGATLSVGIPYLVELIEELHLPDNVRARANPKSSTGRLDVFTRVLTDHYHHFDEIRPGYQGKLYLEVFSRSFSIRVEQGLALNQLRLLTGESRCRDEELLEAHETHPLVFREGQGVTPNLRDGLFLTVRLTDDESATVGYKARRHTLPIDLTKVGFYRWQDFWEPVHPERGGRIVLDPESFYLLLSDEGVSVPPQLAAEMLPYDPSAGELRSHYAGFFDPGFGFDLEGTTHGTRAALEVRARDVPFMIEHGQPICRLVFERMLETPQLLYGHDAGSHYQGQGVMLSKHFVEQQAAAGQLRLVPLRQAAGR